MSAADTPVLLLYFTTITVSCTQNIKTSSKFKTFSREADILEKKHQTVDVIAFNDGVDGVLSFHLAGH